MKKISYLITTFILFFCITSCSGYKPIFISSNIEFKITNYTINGDKKLGNQLYSKLYALSKTNENSTNAKSLDIKIDVSKNKDATAKNSQGKILEYKIILTSNIIIQDILADEEILNKNFTYSTTYKVQDQFSETVKLENKSIKDLINTTYHDLLIKISEKILLQ